MKTTTSSTDPDERNDVRTSLADIESGRVVPHEACKEELRQLLKARRELQRQGQRDESP